jgi:hypothetical protein
MAISHPEGSNILCPNWDLSRIRNNNVWAIYLIGQCIDCLIQEVGCYVNITFNRKYINLVELEKLILHPSNNEIIINQSWSILWLLTFSSQKHFCPTYKWPPLETYFTSKLCNLMKILNTTVKPVLCDFPRKHWNRVKKTGGH